jgi:hypothetical protein
MPNSRYHSRDFTIHEVDAPPAFSDLTLMVEEGSVVDGYGRPKDIARMLTAYEENLEMAIMAIKEGGTPPPLFVPDLWHITFGRAKLFTPEDAERLYEAWTLGFCVGKNYMRQDGGPPSHLLSGGYPGTFFIPKGKSK